MATGAVASATVAGPATSSATADAPVASGSSAAVEPSGAPAQPATAGGIASPMPSASASTTATPSAEASATATAVASAAPTATASAATTAEPALTVQSGNVAEASFAVWMQSAAKYTVGQKGFVEVVLVPKGEFHCNEQYPYKVKLGAAPAGVTYPEAIVRGASVSASRATIRVPFVATTAGAAKISGRFHFSVCKADQCVIDVRDVAATVKVE